MIKYIFSFLYMQKKKRFLLHDGIGWDPFVSDCAKSLKLLLNYIFFRDCKVSEYLNKCRPPWLLETNLVSATVPNCDFFFIERNHIDPRFSIFHQPKEISRILTHFPLSFQTGNNEQWRNCPKKSWVVSHPGVYLAASDVTHINCQSIFFQSKSANLS